MSEDRYIYITGSLYMAANRKVNHQLYEYTGALCESYGHTTFLPHRHIRKEPESKIKPLDLYTEENAALRKAKGMIAFVNEPSFGAGMELMIAAAMKMPILCLQKPRIHVSRYLRGFLEHHEYPDIAVYESDNHMATVISGWLTNSFSKKNAA